MVTFDVPVPESFSAAEIVRAWLLAGQGYTRVHREHPDRIEVIADRLRLDSGSSDRRARAVEAIERALNAGRGRLTVYQLGGAGAGVLFQRRVQAIGDAIKM